MKPQENALSPSEVHSPMEVEVKIYRPSSAQAPYRSFPGTARELTHSAAPPLRGRPAALGSAAIFSAPLSRIQVREGKNGPFISMPSRQVRGEHRDICFPCTAEFKRDFDFAILDTYRMVLAQALEQCHTEELDQEGPTMDDMTM